MSPVSFPASAFFRILPPVLALLFLSPLLTGCDRVSRFMSRLKPAPAAEAGPPLPELVDEAPAEPAEPEPEIDPSTPALTINKSAQVSVLGYHDFITGKSNDQMKINIDHFRAQMQTLKDARLPVISMKDFLAWRRGEKDIPDPSVLITIDDGWNSVYHLALPVLKEFGYPFTVFLYKNYVKGPGLKGGGRAMTVEEIKELIEAGGEVGSHSVSHPFPSEFKRILRQSEEASDNFIRMQMKDSKQFLEDLLGIPVTTYAYPGGYLTQRAQEIGLEAGYEALFTVNPGRVTWDTPATALPRFIVLGNDPQDRAFRMAVSVRGGAPGGELAKQLIDEEVEGEKLVTTTPPVDSTVTDRTPLVEVDVSKLEDIDPSSVSMKVSGFGLVPAVYDPEAGKIFWRVREPLRANECLVFVSFKRLSEPKPDLVSWHFFVDLLAEYLQSPAPEGDAPPDGEETAASLESPSVPVTAPVSAPAAPAR